MRRRYRMPPRLKSVLAVVIVAIVGCNAEKINRFLDKASPKCGVIEKIQDDEIVTEMYCGGEERMTGAFALDRRKDK